MRVRFDPFEKPLRSLRAADLARLRHISEGWYIEYKSSLIATPKLAKSLSAFANHYGGWLFIGIAEASNGTRFAGTFPGLPEAELVRAEQQVREASRTCLNPSVYFEHVLLRGPEPEIGLADGFGILVVAVPQGADPPYVHSDGKIYRRVGDASEPRPENDRTTLDSLWQRGLLARQRLAERIDPHRQASDNERETPHVNVFLSHDPLESSGLRHLVDFDKFATLMSADPLPFTNMFSRSGGHVARQTYNNLAISRVLTWDFDVSGHSSVSVPLNWARTDVGEWLDGYCCADRFARLLPEVLGDARVIDLNQLMMALVAIIARHRALMGASGVEGPFYVKIHLENIWRCIPFLDAEEFCGFIEKNGLPLVQEHRAFAPPGKDLASFHILPSHRVSDSGVTDVGSSIKDAVTVSFEAFGALGVPRSVFAKCAPDCASANERSSEVNLRRSRRSR